MLILQNKDFYVDLINVAGDDAYELKKNFRNLAKQNTDTQLIEFVDAINPEPASEHA